MADKPTFNVSDPVLHTKGLEVIDRIERYLAKINIPNNQRRSQIHELIAEIPEAEHATFLQAVTIDDHGALYVAIEKYDCSTVADQHKMLT